MLSPSLCFALLLSLVFLSCLAMSIQAERTDSNNMVESKVYNNATGCGGSLYGALNYCVDASCSVIAMPTPNTSLSSNVTCLEGGIPYGWMCPTSSCDASETSSCELIDGQLDSNTVWGIAYCQVVSNTFSVSFTCEQSEADPEAPTSPEHVSPSSDPSSPSSPQNPASSTPASPSPSNTPDFTMPEEPATPSEASQLGLSMALLFLALGIALEALL